MMKRLRRTKLFCPGDRPDRFPKAVATAADSICLDLEDAVAAGQKTQARESIHQGLTSINFALKERAVRVNSLGSGLLLADLEAIVCHELDAIYLPKVEGPRDVWVVEAVLDHLERKIGRTYPVVLIPTLESPTGFENAREIATASRRVVALQWGVGDLTLSLGMIPSPHRLAYPRTRLVFAAYEAGIDALDTTFPKIDDLEACRADALEARALGFRGKSAIHPTQVTVINEVFSPSAKEIAQARVIVAAYEDAAARKIGAFQLDGNLIDLPNYTHAKQILVAANQLDRAE